MNEQLYNVSANPHVRDKASTHSIMLDVIIALLPATLFGFWNFGVKAIINTVICVAVCVLAEYVWQRCMHQKITIKDCSAALTGLLLALNLPPEVPFWIPVIGGLFAIIVVKQLFGGLGQNFMNPALGARCFLLISFAGIMTNFSYNGFGGSFDATTSATPLAALKAGEVVNLKAMFLGNTAGTIGETSALLLLVGGVYLIAKKIISWRIPVCYIVTLGLFVLLFGGHGFDMTYFAEQLCGGGLMLGAFFMATDYVTSPITPKGQIVFGILLGILTGIFRLFGGSAEGVSYAIIFCNLLYGITKKPIADQEAKAQMEAYKAVFPKASDFKDVDGFSEEAASKVIASYKNTVDGHESDVISSAVEAVDASGKALGYIFNITTSKGYGGDIQLTVGIQSDGTVSGYSVLSISETAGLGMKAKDDPSWGKQFAGKKADAFSVVKDGSGSGDDAKIDAISGATITSKAVTGAMNSCLAYFQSLEGGN